MEKINTDQSTKSTVPGCAKDFTNTNDGLSSDSIEYMDGISDSESDDNSNSSKSSSSSCCCSCRESDSGSAVNCDKTADLKQNNSLSKNSNNKGKRKIRRKKRGQTKSAETSADLEEISSILPDSSPQCSDNPENDGPLMRVKTVPHQSSTESSDFCVEYIERQKSEVLTSPIDKDGDPILDIDGVPLKFDGEKTDDKVDITGLDFIDENLNNMDTIADDNPVDVANESSDGPDNNSDTNTSSSSDEECTLVESQKTQLQICGNSDFCWIDTRSNTYRGKIYTRHYVLKKEGTDIEGEIGLKPLDELLRVNGKSLKNKTQKKVKSIFRRIKLNQKTNQVNIELRVRRWFRDQTRGPLHEKKWKEVKEYELHLVLVPSDYEIKEEEISREKVNRCDRKPYVRSQSFRVERSTLRPIHEERLSAGCIDIISLKGTQLCRYRSVVLGQYISNQIHTEGFVSTSFITDTNTCEFRAEHFLGIDEAPKSAFSNKFIFCTRLCIELTPGLLFLSSNIAQGEEELKFEVSYKDDFENLKSQHIIDERCFIIRAIGDVVLFQSLIYRDRFISVNRESGRLYLIQISKTEQNAFVAGEEQPEKRGEAYYNAVKKFQMCKFEKFKVRHGLSHILHRTLDNFVGRFLCGIGHTGATDHVTAV